MRKSGQDFVCISEYCILQFSKFPGKEVLMNMKRTTLRGSVILSSVLLLALLISYSWAGEQRYFDNSSGISYIPIPGWDSVNMGNNTTGWALNSSTSDFRPNLVVVAEKTEKAPPASWKDAVTRLMAKDNAKVLSFNNFSISGFEGCQFDALFRLASLQVKKREFLLQGHGVCICIVGGATSEDFEKYAHLFDNVAKTLRYEPSK